jgi:hypothetical protein
MSTFQKFQRLWKQLEDAITLPSISLSGLQVLLSQHKQFFLLPLTYDVSTPSLLLFSLTLEQPQTPEARRAVESGNIVLDGRTHRLTPEFIKEVTRRIFFFFFFFFHFTCWAHFWEKLLPKQSLTISEALKLNEISSVELLRLAYQSVKEKKQKRKEKEKAYPLRFFFFFSKSCSRTKLMHLSFSSGLDTLNWRELKLLNSFFTTRTNPCFSRCSRS